MDHLKGKNVLVMGLGLNQGGLSVVNYLLKHEAKVTITDLKTAAQLKSTIKDISQVSKVKLVLGRHRISDFIDADLIFANPAVPNNSKYLIAAKNHKVPITNEAAYFIANTNAKVIELRGRVVNQQQVP